jgi:hypothetical protein
MSRSTVLLVGIAASTRYLQPHLAGLGEDGRAVPFDMLVVPNAGTGLGQDRYERGLADLERASH